MFVDWLCSISRQSNNQCLQSRNNVTIASLGVFVNTVGTPSSCAYAAHIRQRPGKSAFLWLGNGIVLCEFICLTLVLY